MLGQTRGIDQMKSIISLKEYQAQKGAEHEAPTANKSTPEEEDWDADPPLPPQETPPGAGSMAPSQEDEWEQMIHQDPHSGSIAGDSGHSTMTVMKETESMEETEELTAAVGGVKESTSAEYLSDVKWREDDPLFVFDDDNVMKPQAPTTAFTPIQACKEGTVSTPFESSQEEALLQGNYYRLIIEDNPKVPRTQL